MLPPAKPQPVSWEEQIETESRRDTQKGKRRGKEGKEDIFLRGIQKKTLKSMKKRAWRTMAQHLHSSPHWLCCPFCVSVGCRCLTESLSAWSCRLLILTWIHAHRSPQEMKRQCWFKPYLLSAQTQATNEGFVCYMTRTGQLQNVFILKEMHLQ